MARLCKFTPWLTGDQETMADIYVHYVNNLVGAVGVEQLEWDILAQIPGMKEWNALMRDSDIAQTVEAGRVANQPGFKAYIAAYMEAQREAG
jgi:glutathione S-transferase